MKNLSLIRRFILGSLIMSATVPLLYYIGRDAFRDNHIRQITEQACKAIEPMIQKGSQREPLEYLSSTILNQGEYALPEIEMKDHGKLITPEIKKPFSKKHVDCEFQGISGVDVKVYYSSVPILDITYLYLYLISLPVLFFLFLYARRLIIRLQKKIADIIEFQMKQLFGLEKDQIVRPQNGLLYKLFDLEIPLLGYLKKHIESLETDLKLYSQKIAEQQKRDVLKDVASQMAHEILTPISNLQIILQDKSAFEKRDLLLLELTQIKSLSENLLREYRGDQSIPRNTVKKINVVETVKTVIDGVKLFAKDKGNVEITFKNQFEGQDLFVLGDRSQFVAAISNLLRNSVEALDKDERWIEVSVENYIKRFRILIKDNGCGIKNENLERIFEKRFSLGKDNGTGLGLHQVKSAIEAMGGEIRVQSQFGEYTIFEIDLSILGDPKVSEKESVQTNEVTTSPDLVLIDDTYINHLAWEIEAERNKKKIATFFSVDEFFEKGPIIKKETPIFVDYVFKDDLTAGSRVSQVILDKGYSKVFIASGLFEKDIIAPSGVKVVTKEFPTEWL